MKCALVSFNIREPANNNAGHSHTIRPESKMRFLGMGGFLKTPMTTHIHTLTSHLLLNTPYLLLPAPITHLCSSRSSSSNNLLCMGEYCFNEALQVDRDKLSLRI